MKEQHSSHVLVVEDECSIREALCTALQESGYVAAAASGVHHAREHLARAEVHAVPTFASKMAMDSSCWSRSTRAGLAWPSS
jgi:DNA-binding NtrC family response regulator